MRRELADLGMGRCRMCVAGRKGTRESRDQTLRVATKFPNIAKRYAALGQGDIHHSPHPTFRTVRKVRPSGARRLRLDFSIVNNMDYYNGLIFRGYLPGLPSGVLSGGRYDNLLHSRGTPALSSKPETKPRWLTSSR
mgnify:CR=1 FL=1